MRILEKPGEQILHISVNSVESLFLICKSMHFFRKTNIFDLLPYFFKKKRGKIGSVQRWPVGLVDRCYFKCGQ